MLPNWTCSGWFIWNLRTFIRHRDGAVEVLLLHIPGGVVHLIGDAAETAAVNFDGCKLKNKKQKCISATLLETMEHCIG